MQQIVNSPLQVEKYFIKELSFKINTDIEIDSEDFDSLNAPEIGVAASVTKRGDKRGRRKWNCELIIKTEDEVATPYNFQIVLFGYFTILKDYPSDRCELLAKVNCPSVLYSTAREIISTTIRRSPFPPLMLPSMMFLEVDENADSTKPSKNRKKSK